MFGFGKVKQKLSATRFEFSFVVHNLAPWPEGQRAIAIGYQRGKRRRGATRSVYPSRQPGRLGAVVRFNERFDMPVTLYKASSGNATSSGGLGPFKKKCLILAILETDGRTQATAALGRVVIDVSEYAAIEHQETRTFQVTCNKAIHAAVGEPQLMVTIRCRWKKLGKESGGGGVGAAAGANDDTASMSTDTTGSRMTANLSSFLRFKFTGQGGRMNEEQDLRGFDSVGSLPLGTPLGSYQGSASSLGNAGSVPGRSTGSSSSAANGGGANGDLAMALSTKQMDTIQESHDEPAEPAFPSPPGMGTSRNITPQTSSKQLGSAGSHGLDNGTERAVSGPLEAGVAGMSLREQYNAKARSSVPSGPGHSPRGSRPDMLATVADSATSRMSGRGEGAERVPSSTSLLQPGSESELVAALRFELLTTAALEAAVYLARRPQVTAAPWDASSNGTPGASGPLLSGPAMRAAHAPARRISRTVLCLGQVDGPAFGGAALRLMRAQVATVGDGSGLDSLPYWWSNVVHMRAILQGLSLAAALGGNPSPRPLLGTYGLSGPSGGAGGDHWASQSLVPELRRLERHVFDEMLWRLWQRVLLPTVLGTGGRAAKEGVAKVAATTKRAQQEAAIKKWFEGLEAVAAALSRLGGGHAPLLRQQALLQCLKRLDLLLFYHLLGGAGAPGVAAILDDYDPHGTLRSGGGGSIPQLDESSLPFGPGVLTFGGGMSVKMTVTRLQQWAAAQPSLGGGSGGAAGDGAAGGAGADRMGGGGGGGMGGMSGSPGPLFPLLRAASDLLMMPKELLMDRAVRQDVGSALSLRSVIHILERFQPDEFAQDSISPAILEALQEDAALPQMHMRSPAADLNAGYVPPPDAQLLRGAEGGQEPGLEYDGDSEDELAEITRVVSTYAPGGSGSAGLTRFRLLHDLWSSGMPRSRRTYSAASGSEQGMGV